MNENLLNEARYVAMPEYADVAKTVNVEDVRDGDLRGDRLVDEIKVGRIKVELRGNGKRIDYLPLGTPVLVVRTEETDESRELGQRMRQNRSILASLLTRRSGLDRAQERLNEHLAEYGTVEPGRLADLVASGAEYKVWEDLYQIAVRVQEDTYTGDFEGDLVALVERFCVQLRERLLQPFGFRALSRSTGVVHNLLEDCDREAMAKFLDNTRWYL